LLILFAVTGSDSGNKRSGPVAVWTVETAQWSITFTSKKRQTKWKRCPLPAWQKEVLLNESNLSINISFLMKIHRVGNSKTIIWQIYHISCYNIRCCWRLMLVEDPKLFLVRESK
jgi:hypothetical protein